MGDKTAADKEALDKLPNLLETVGDADALVAEVLKKLEADKSELLVKIALMEQKKLDDTE